jgi:small-conductance mechanosensitive channel
MLALVILVLGIPCSFAGDDKQAVDEQQPLYVYIDGMPVLAVFTNIGPVSKSERFNIIQAKIDTILRDKNLDASNFKTADEENGTRIYYGQDSLMLVSKADAACTKSATGEMAKDYVEKLRNAIAQYKEDSRFSRLLLGVLGSIIGLFALLFVAGKTGNICSVMAKTTAAAVSKRSRLLGEVFSEITHTAAHFLAKTIFFLVLGLCFYVYVYSVLNYFPWTRIYAEQMLDRTLAPLTDSLRRATEYVPNLFLIAIIAYVTYGLVVLLKFLFTEIGRQRLNIPDFDPEWAEPTFKLTRALFIFLSLIVAAPYLPGWGSPAFNQVGLFLGLLVSLGSTGAIGHLVAGVVLTYTRAFRIGDRVKIGDHTGDVISRTLFTTQIRTIKNEQVTLHNGKVISSEIVNYTSNAASLGLILHTSVTIGYDVSWRTVHDLLLAAAGEADCIEKEPAPFVLQRALEDFCVEYELNAFTRQADKMVQIYSFLHQSIQDKFNEAGVEIMSPRYSALRDGNGIAIPSQYLDKDYKAPAFKFSR